VSDDLDDLRDVALDVTFDKIARDVTVQRPEPDAVPYTTQGVWLSALEESQPFGADITRKDPRRVMVFRRSATLPEIVRGTKILAAELKGGTVKTWKVDGFVQATEPDVIRPVLVQIPSA
jgi:hypothetical protein